VAPPEREAALARWRAQEFARERQSIADELHNDALQAMVAVLIRLGILARQLSDPEQVAVVEQVEANTRDAIIRLRALIDRLADPKAGPPTTG
jgi:signal transduction histidine kinase